MKKFSYKHMSLCIALSLSSSIIEAAQTNCFNRQLDKPANNNQDIPNFTRFEYIPDFENKKRSRSDQNKCSCCLTTMAVCAGFLTMTTQSYLITHTMGWMKPNKYPSQYPTQSPTSFNPIDHSLRGFLDKEKNE